MHQETFCHLTWYQVECLYQVQGEAALGNIRIMCLLQKELLLDCDIFNRPEWQPPRNLWVPSLSPCRKALVSNKFGGKSRDISKDCNGAPV